MKTRAKPRRRRLGGRQAAKPKEVVSAASLAEEPAGGKEARLGPVPCGRGGPDFFN
jgi:hypothetical protein